MGFIRDIFGRDRALVGVLHLLPLPGSPRWEGDIGAVLSRAVDDAKAYEDAGFDGLIIENFGDAPFARGFAGRGAVAALAAAGERVSAAVDLPLGVNVLRNDALSAVAVAAAIGGRFIRVNVHVGAAVCDQGIVQGEAMETMRSIGATAPDLRVAADVAVKHAVRLGGRSVADEARDAVERGLASALIVTGPATGSPASLDEVREVRAAAEGTDVLVGSGVDARSVERALEASSGVIVGSAAMKDGRAGGPVDPARARQVAEAAGR